MAFAPGNRIGKYELGVKIGAGGFGEVFLATDTELGRDVALKFLHAQHTADPEILKRFLQEAKAAAKIDHPGIVTIHEFGQIAGTGTPADGTAFIAMERLHGESLSARITRERVTPAAAVEICRQVASALAAAHAKGVVHRDLKPDNVFLVPDVLLTSGERVKVLDFGIAKLADAGGVHTHTSMVFGTPRYMSPEQCRSATAIDHRSDIYTLGVILFELLCGRPPFEGGSGELIAKHQLVEPPAAGTIISVPEPLDRLVSSLLAKEPADRPQTMVAVNQALVACAPMVANLKVATPNEVAATMAPSQPTADVPKTPIPSKSTADLAPATPSSVKSAQAEVRAPAASAASPASVDTEPMRSGRKPYLVIGLGIVAAGAIAFGIVKATSHGDAPPPERVAVIPAGDAAPAGDAPIALAVAPSADAATVLADTQPVAVPVPVLVDAGVPEDAHRRGVPPDAHRAGVRKLVDAGVIARPPDAAAVRPPHVGWPPEGTPMTGSTLRNIMARCQGEYSDAHPGTLNGLEIQVAANVDADGNVHIQAKSQLPDIDRCIEKYGRGMSFPPGHPIATVSATGGTVLRPPE